MAISQSSTTSRWSTLPRWVRLLLIVAAVEFVVFAGLLAWMKVDGIL